MRPLPAPPDPTPALAATGDEAARRALVEAHGPRLWAFVARTSDQPHDAYQEVWARVFGALPRFDPAGPATFATWLLTVAHRWLVDQERRRRVRGDLVSADELAHEPDPGRAIDRRRLERAIADLPEDQRRVVIAHHLEDQPLEAIALLEGVPLGTLKSRLHRGRARLLEALSDGGG